MAVKTLIMATNNEHKLREIRQILGDRFQVKGLADIGCNTDIPETSDTLEGNALQKARYVADKFGVDCFADDTGMEVDALGGAPGIYTARYGSLNGYGDSHDSNANIRSILDKLKGQTQRTARFRTVIALVRGGKDYLFEGRVEGRIVEQLRGTQGFGYDPVFVPDDFPDRTVAELGEAVKNQISHRGKSLRAMAAWLKENLPEAEKA